VRSPHESFKRTVLLDADNELFGLDVMLVLRNIWIVFYIYTTLLQDIKRRIQLRRIIKKRIRSRSVNRVQSRTGPQQRGYHVQAHAQVVGPVSQRSKGMNERMKDAASHHMSSPNS